MSQAKGKVGATHNSRDETKYKPHAKTQDQQNQQDQQAKRSKAPTPLSKPGQGSTAQETKTRRRKGNKAKEDAKEQTPRGEEGNEISQTGRDAPWFVREEEEQSRKGLTKDEWDQTSEEEQEEQETLKTPEVVCETKPQDKRRKIREDAQQEKTENPSPLTRFARSDKAITKALMRISSIVGDNQEIHDQIDAILTEQSRFKNMIMVQHEELAFLKGRICELEKREKKEKPQGQEVDTPEEGKKPTYALVVSSGTMRKKEVATMIKRNIDPAQLGIQDATMREGKEGVILTTTSKEDAGKLEQQIKNNTTNNQVKRPKENKYPIKVIGISEDEELENVVEKIIRQNHLPCEPEDITLTKNWKGKQEITAVFTLNKAGHQAVNNKSHLNIGWDRCKVFDHFFVPRCTRCAEHGHSSFDCEGPHRCVRCGRGGHRQEDCVNQPHCHVCGHEGREGREHSSMAWECPAYLDKVKQEKMRILARLV